MRQNLYVTVRGGSKKAILFPVEANVPVKVGQEFSVEGFPFQLKVVRIGPDVDPAELLTRP